MSWRIILSNQAEKDAERITKAGLKPQAMTLLEVLRANPYQTPPRFEKLTGNLRGYCSRRINIQHRLVYRIDKAAHAVHILRMWTHYE